jgi:hypothetical protein
MNHVNNFDKGSYDKYDKGYDRNYDKGYVYDKKYGYNNYNSAYENYGDSYQIDYQGYNKSYNRHEKKYRTYSNNYDETGYDKSYKHKQNVDSFAKKNDDDIEVIVTNTDSAYKKPYKKEYRQYDNKLQQYENKSYENKTYETASSGFGNIEKIYNNNDNFQKKKCDTSDYGDNSSKFSKSGSFKNKEIKKSNFKKKEEDYGDLQKPVFINSKLLKKDDNDKVETTYTESRITSKIIEEPEKKISSILNVNSNQINQFVQNTQKSQVNELLGSKNEVKSTITVPIQPNFIPISLLNNNIQNMQNIQNYNFNNYTIAIPQTQQHVQNNMLTNYYNNTTYVNKVPQQSNLPDNFNVKEISDKLNLNAKVFIPKKKVNIP